MTQETFTMRYLPTKYVLYTHYPYGERHDLEKWHKHDEKRNNGTLNPDDLASIKHLRQHLPELASLLSTAGMKGMLVLFFGPGKSFAELLDGVADGKLLSDISTQDLRYAKFWRHHAVNVLKKEAPDVAPRVRLVIPQDFHRILHRMHESHRDRVRLRFVGRREALFYDAPKIVEAVVRVRIAGTGVPVFRIDHDVLFTENNWEDADLGLYKPISLSLEGYRRRYADHRTAAFMHSVSYDQLGITRSSAYPVFDYATAFATRIQPALVINKQLISTSPEKLTKRLPKEMSPWDAYAHKVFDKELAHRFYGLDPSGQAITQPHGLARIGSHPLISIISGALLCFSDLAIQLLPPFSNFGLNVSWIDDHLKYCLHRELRHFLIAGLEDDPTIGGARLADAYVRKGRQPIGNLLQYTLENYLPTLLYGTIMDAWVNSDPLLKFRVADLKKKSDRVELKRLRNAVQRYPDEKPGAPLAAAMKEALNRGNLPSAQENNLRSQLQVAALARIKEVRQQWSKLRRGRNVTFAAAWADGSAAKRIPFLLKNPGDGNDANRQNKSIGRGIAPNKRVDEDLVLTDLEPNLIIGISELIENAVDYISWTLEWPRIVQTVLSFPYGTFITDPPHQYRHGK